MAVTLRSVVRDLLQEDRAWSVAEMTARVKEVIPAAQANLVRNAILYEVDCKRAVWLAPGQYSGVRPDGTPRVLPSSPMPTLVTPADPPAKPRRVRVQRSPGSDLAAAWGVRHPKRQTPLPVTRVVHGRRVKE